MTKALLVVDVQIVHQRFLRCSPLDSVIERKRDNNLVENEVKGKQNSFFTSPSSLSNPDFSHPEISTYNITNEKNVHDSLVNLGGYPYANTWN